MSPAGVAVAFAAGLVSFLAPCVLPLVPGYLSAVSSVEADRLGEPGSAGRIVLSSLPFVAGLVSVFVLLGAGAAAIGLSIAENQFLLEQIAGFVLIVFGLVFMGLLPGPSGCSAPGSSRERGGGVGLPARRRLRDLRGAVHRPGARLDPRPRRRLRHGARGLVLLAVYALGLAVPFLVAAALFVPAMGFFRWIRDHYATIQLVSGAILVALGAAALLRPLLVAARLPEPRSSSWLGLG